MEDLLLYIVKSVFAGALLYAYYELFLKNRKHNQLNRVFLILFFPLALLFPVIHVAFLSWSVSPVVEDWSLHVSENKWQPFTIVVGFYALIAITLLIIVIKNILGVLRLRNHSVVYKEKNFWLVETSDERAPFSFFNNLFWKRDADRTSEEGRKIFKHEMVHIHQLHSYDRLISQLFCAIYWMNPFFWWAQAELGTVHEFLADEKSFGPDETNEFARTVLSSYSGGRYLHQQIGFHKSDIARRLRMISQLNEKQSWGRASPKGFLFLTCLVLILLAGSYAPGKPPTEERRKKTEAFEKKLRDERSSMGQRP